MRTGAILWVLVLLIPASLPADTASHLRLKLDFPEFIRTSLLEGRTPAGFTPFGSAGDPAIYGKVLHVAVPAGSNVALRITRLDATRSSAVLRTFEDLPLATKHFSRVYPQQPVWVSAPRKFRQVEYVDVFVFPVRYDLHSHQAIFTHSVAFELSFDRRAGIKIEEKEAISRFNDRFFANEWRDKGGTPSKTSRTPALSWQPPPHTGTVYKIKIRQDGIYNLDTAFLSAHTDWTIASVDPRKLRLFNRGVEVPVTITGESDGTLDPGDTLSFHGRAYAGESDPGVWQSGDFTDDNVYWLLVGDVNGLRMGTRDVTPANTFTVPSEFVSTEHFEVNAQIVPFQTQPDTDLWLWKNALWFDTDSSQAVQHHNVTVPSVSSDGSYQASLKFMCRARSYDENVNPDHHVIVKLNGSTLGDFTMNDYEIREADYTFNQSLLGGTGDVPIDLSHEVTDPALLGTTIDAVQSNWFEITYERLFAASNDRLSFHYGDGSFQFEIPGFSSAGISLLDVTAPDAPVLLTGAQITGGGPSQIAFQDVIAGGADYLAMLPIEPAVADFIADVPSNLAGIDPSTNWILIAPDAWVNNPAIQNLKTLRQSQGLNSVIVSVTDIYDEYSYGIFTPYAIKDFLQSVYNLAVPANLQYVVLLGDADYDYKDYTGNGDFNLVPTYMVADPGLGSVSHPYAMHSFDNYYGSYDGDSIPDIFIGRIPVRTLAQAQDAANKIIAYEGITDHSWLGDNLFAADCQEYFAFEPEQDTNASLLPGNSASVAHSMYFRLPPWNCNIKDADNNLVADVVDELNAGRVTTSWLGHGGLEQWGVASYLDNTDIPSLTNSSRPTVMLNANCFTGAFYHADTSALMEDLFVDTGGIVSGFGPGTYMFSFQAGQASEPFYSDVYGHDKVRMLGPLYQHLYLNLADDRRVLEGMVAFGDPASHLPIPAMSPPQNLHLTATTCSAPALAWDPPAAGAVAGYNVYRAMDAAGPFTLLNGSLIASTSYTDFTAAQGTTYYYYVAALDAELFEGQGSNILIFTDTGAVLTIAPATIPHGVDGTPYSQVLTASGGTGPYTFAVESGTLPPGITLASDGTLSGIPTAPGSYDFVVMVSDPGACSTQPFTLIIDAPCLFCDDFEDGVLAADWTYSKPVYTESGGNLAATSAKKATALATPVFSGCDTCSIESTMQTAGGLGNQLRLYGWYQSKQNDVEVLLKEERDRIVVKQRSGGRVVAKGKALFAITPGVYYKIRIAFDGAAFQVFADDVLQITLPKAPGTSPFGTTGFFVKATTGTFAYITVN